MKFAKIVFWAAGIYGVLVLTPLYFMFHVIGLQDPPPITHPGFYYGFVGAGLAWQFAFFVIATDPVRYRPLMIPSIFEKWSFGIAMTALFLQGRIHPSDFALGSFDFLLGVLFLISSLATRKKSSQSAAG